MSGMRKVILALLVAGPLAACSGGDRGLHRFGADATGPDEFSVMPMRPLQMPETFALADPTPGGSNRADPNPVGDAIATLGGSQAAGNAGGVPASDVALVAVAGRAGIDPAIRATLAAEDAAFRRRASVINALNWAGRDRYFRAYAGQALDAYAELARFRALGVAVPSAPPGN